jgi:hypothetical protein
LRLVKIHRGQKSLEDRKYKRHGGRKRSRRQDKSHSKPARWKHIAIQSNFEDMFAEIKI